VSTPYLLRYCATRELTLTEYSVSLAMFMRKTGAVVDEATPLA